MSTTRHTRTRSAGIPVAAGKALQSQLGPLPQRPSDSAASSSSSSGSPTTTTIVQTASLNVFLRNLKLLDLDLRPDWPDITADTFAASGVAPGARRGNAAQGQKKRIQCVEWALFHLFALWDPEETRYKLKPFFPPLNQMQSTNLRAAILRALEQEKKQGALGRDAIIRKTMLDECRGERLEEVLAVFSSAVLSKVIAGQLQGTSTIVALALGFALDKRGYRDDRAELHALSLAHRASLCALLDRKKAAAARYRDFADFLRVKERSLARKKEEILADETKNRDKGLADEMRTETLRLVRNNWTGDERWMDALIYGDGGVDSDGFMGMPFDRVWRRVEQGRLADVEDSQGSLLEQLEARVRAQKEGLRKWDAFRKKKFGDKPQPSPSKTKSAEQKSRGIDLGFDRHENLQLGRTSPRKTAFTNKGPQMSSEYASLMRGLEDELAAVSNKNADPFAFLRRPSLQRPRFAGDTGVDEEMSELSDPDDEIEPSEVPIQSFQAKLDQAKRLPARPKLSHPTGSHVSASSSSFTSTTREPRSAGGSRDLDSAVPSHSHSAVESNILQPSSLDKPSTRGPETMPPPPRPTQSQQPQRSPSPTQGLADEILASMKHASPSPSKRPKPRHTLSLDERTRLSMARGPDLFQDSEPEPVNHTATPISPTAKSTPTPHNNIPTPQESTHVSHESIPTPRESKAPTSEESEDLASRTRRSMAGFDKARQKAQMERRRSLRRSKLPPRVREGSYFPGVAEEGDEAAEEKGVLAEALMEKEVDMEAVFRSRPKIQDSPTPSPTKEWDE